MRMHQSTVELNRSEVDMDRVMQVIHKIGKLWIEAGKIHPIPYVRYGETTARAVLGRLRATLAMMFLSEDGTYEIVDPEVDKFIRARKTQKEPLREVWDVYHETERLVKAAKSLERRKKAVESKNQEEREVRLMTQYPKMEWRPKQQYQDYEVKVEKDSVRTHYEESRVDKLLNKSSESSSEESDDEEDGQERKSPNQGFSAKSHMAMSNHLLAEINYNEEGAKSQMAMGNHLLAPPCWIPWRDMELGKYSGKVYKMISEAEDNHRIAGMTVSDMVDVAHRIDQHPYLSFQKGRPSAKEKLEMIEEYLEDLERWRDKEKLRIKWMNCQCYGTPTNRKGAEKNKAAPQVMEPQIPRSPGEIGRAHV